MRRLALLTATLALVASTVAPANAEPPRDALSVWVPTGEFETSSFERVAQTAPQPVPDVGDRSVSLSTVRGGHASAQLAVASTVDLEDLRVQVGPLTAPGAGVGAITNAIQVRYPTYIPSYLGSTGPGPALADPLLEADRVDLTAGKVQPVWFTLAVPADAEPGTYKSRIVIRAHKVQQITYDLTVEVSDVTLPPPSERNFDLNLWFQPDTIADQLGLELWSDEHFDAMQPYLRDLAEHGQRVINTAAIFDPWPRALPGGIWRAQTYVPFNSLIEWFYDGETWSFDFTNWDRFVEESLRAGVGPRISVFGLLGFKGNHHIVYTDTRTDSEVYARVGLGGELWTEAWAAFLTGFEDHVRDRGWLNQTHMAFDERPTSEMRTAFELVEESAPELADNLFAIAGGGSSDPYAFELSLNEGSRDSWSQEMIDRRNKEGKVTTFYTWNEPVHPNTLTQSPPLGARLLSWISAQRNLNGFLRWSYNSWTEDPYTVPTYMGVVHGSHYRGGDEYLIYPGAGGPISSIRWELFRDGQEDFALLEQLGVLGGEDNPVRLDALERVDTSNSLPTEATYEELLSARAMVIDELEKLAED